MGRCFCPNILLSKGRKAETMRNLNIKSDEAYELAHFIAKRKGQSVTAAVTALLKREKGALTKDELLAKWKKTAEDNWQRMTPEQRNWDYREELYDEYGLPK